MRGLLARIAQRATCRCPQCMSRSNVMSRRAANTAAYQGLATPGTVLYSGLLAAALSYDARVKIARRERWDSAIAEMRKELECNDEPVGKRQQEPAEEDMKGHEMEIMEKDLADEENDSNFDPIGLSLSGNALESRLKDEYATVNEPDYNIFENIQPRNKALRVPENTHGPINDHRVAPDSLYAKSNAKRKATRRRWTPKKVENMNIQMDIFQVQIAVMLYECGLVEEAVAAMPSGHHSFISQPIDTLVQCYQTNHMRASQIANCDYKLSGYYRQEDGMYLSNYYQDVYGGFHSITSDLNSSLKRLFSSHFRNELSRPALLARISHNLAVSSAPPNIDTFNILLIGFGHAKEHVLSECVVRLVKESKIRPNEVTLSRILDHYTVKSDAKGWARWVGIIRGKYGGLGLAQPNVEITEVSEGRLIPVMDEEGEEVEKVIQTMHPTPMVFSSIMNGSLKFLGLEQSMYTYNEFKEQGWGLSYDGLTALLSECVAVRDWVTGEALLSHIERLEEDEAVPGPARGDYLSQRIGLESFTNMLQSCRADEQRDIFNRILTHAENFGHERQHIMETLCRQAAQSQDGDTIDAAPEVPSVNEEGGQQETSRPRSSWTPLWRLHSRLRRSHPPPEDQEPVDTSVKAAYVMTREELDGTVASNEDLSQYEILERPMNLEPG